MKRFLLACAMGLMLSACSVVSAVNTAANSSPSQTVINQARNTVLAADNAYGLAIIVADQWAGTPQCGKPGALPVCPTNSSIIAVNRAAVAARTGLNEAEALVMKASPQQSDLDLAMSGATAAVQTYKDILSVYHIKAN